VGPGNIVIDVGRETGDPFDTRKIDISAHKSGHGNDPVDQIPVPQVRLYGLGKILVIEAPDSLFNGIDGLFPVNPYLQKILFIEINHGDPPFKYKKMLSPYRLDIRK
jgi:hypothetical protein